MPWGPGRASILRVLGTSDADLADNPNVDLQVDFPEFGIDVRVRLPRSVRPHAALTLATMNKDNEPQWLDDWCTWHHRVHGVGRFVFYDNGSADRDGVYTELARRVKGPEFIVVDWDYVYGPPLQHGLKFAQTVALNHCRLFFGPYTDWCINLDVDEYLFNAGSQSLASYLDRMPKPHVDLPSYIVRWPSTTARDAASTRRSDPQAWNSKVANTSMGWRERRSTMSTASSRANAGFRGSSAPS